MTTVPLWVYKCNARNPPPGVVVADWEQFFREGRREWGSTQAIRSAVSLRVLREEMAEGDLVLAIQTDRRAAMGLCRVAEFDDYRGADGRWERDVILESLRRFHPPVRLYELKKAQRALTQVKALQQGPVQTLYATTPREARILLEACGVEPGMLIRGRS